MAVSSSDQTLPETSPDGSESWVVEGRPETQIGRFTVLRRIGKGGMGVVYVAYDAELDRRVAVKLLRPELSARPEVRDQLVGEAQMLAKLSHPNVLHVYDVGLHHHQIYLALEYVEGETLRAWQARQVDWRMVVAMYRTCGEGLAAAHSAGVIHRDFKPENVLVGVDGRPRVLDFGLAIHTETGSGSLESASGEQDRGRQVGTPAYMSPEQHAGLIAGARSDQFNFCASLYEALYGARPFKGASIEELGESVRRGAPIPPRRGTPVWLRRVVLRGLSVDPEARWPSMLALIDELDRVRRPAILWSLYMTVVVLVAGALFALRGDDPICRGAASRMLGIWDPERRAVAEQAVLRTDVLFAERTWERVAKALDQQADGWIKRRNDTCAATYVRGEQSATLLDRRNACLDDRLRELDAFVRVLIEARPETISAAIGAAGSLRPLSVCDDDEALLAGASRPEDPALAAAADQVRFQVAQVEGLRRSGDFTAAMRVAEAAQRAALSLKDPALQAESGLARGRAALGMARLPEAAEQLEVAFHTARRLRYDDITLAAALELISASADLSRFVAAEFWVRIAEDDLPRASDPVGSRVAWLSSRGKLALDQRQPMAALSWIREALELQDRERHADPATPRIYGLLGLALYNLDRLDESLKTYDEGLALAVEIFGEDHPDVVPLIHGRATVLAGRGRFDEALAASRRALAINAAVFGSAHPQYAGSLAAIGVFVGSQGQHDAAVEYLERALAIRTRALGPDHPLVGETLVKLGKFEYHRGKVDAALQATQRALFILTRALGEGHGLVAMTKLNLGLILSSRGYSGLALALLTEAQQKLETIFPPEHENLMVVRGNRNKLLRRLKRYDEAIFDYTQIVPIAETPGVEKSWLMGTLTELGETYLERGTPAEAVPPLERALGLAIEEARDVQQRDATRALVQAATGDDPGFARAKIELQLARALWDSRIDRARAKRIAVASAASLRDAGPEGAAQLKEVQQWLRRRTSR